MNPGRASAAGCAGWLAGLWLAAAAAPVDPADAAVPMGPGKAVGQLATEVRDLGWIVYGARSARGDWDLFTCRPDGSDVRPVTSTPQFNEFAPQVTRDGRRLLYRRMASTENIDGNRYGEQGELVVARVDGSDPRAMGRAGELPWATWNPEGTQVASLSRNGLSVVELAGGRVERTLPRRGFFQQLSWSPDGREWLGVANSFGTGWSVARMDTTTGEAAAVHRIDCCTPDWFPDSRRVVFSWRPPGQSGNGGQGWTQLWMADVEGTRPQLLYGEDGRHVYGGQVSPDGRHVLFTGNLKEDGDPGNAGAPMGLMRVADAPIVAGASPELRAKHAGAASGPVLVLPAGWEPCWTAGPVGARTAVTDPQGAARTARTAGELRAELRGTGWLVFSARSADGDWDLFLMRPDGSGRRAITATPEFNEGGARFSPDGASLLYYRMARADVLDNNTYGTFDLVLAKADGTEPEIWGRGFPWASWGPDGSRIACLTPQGIQVIEVGTRRLLQQLPRRGFVSQLVWSPDGRRFTGTANGLGPFWNIGCLEAESGQIRALSETERYNCTPDWSPDGQEVFYARGIIPDRGGRAELWVAKAAGGGAPTRVYAEEGWHIYGACASPDGRFVLFTRSREDLGHVPEIGMSVIRRSPPGDDPGPRLDLGPGWEPHWTSSELR